MSIFQRIFNTKATVPVQGEPLPSVTIQYNRRIMTTSETDIQEIYKNSTLIQACMNQWINEVSSAPMKPYVNDTPSDNALLDIFNVKVIQQIIYQMLLSGTAFLYKIRNGAGELVAVQVLSGFHVIKKYDTNGYLLNWEYQTSKGTFTIEKDDVVPITWFTKSVDDEDFGISPINTIIQSAEQINEFTRFVTDSAANDFTPRTILSAPVNMNLTNAQQKQILDQVREEFQTNPGSIKVLNGGWTIERLSIGLNDLDTQMLRVVPEVDICASFMIPPMLINVVAGLQASTYNNVAEARRYFVQNTISGMWSKLEQTINENFSFEFSQQPEWYFETADLASMKEDNQEKFLRLQAMYQANVISRGEFRAEMDLEDIDNGQQVYYQDLISPFNFGTASAEPPAPEPILPPTKAVSKKKVKKLTIPPNDVETKAVFWRRYNTITNRNSKEFKAIVDGMIDDMKQRTISAVGFNSTYIANGNLKREDFQKYNEGILKAQDEIRRQLANDLSFRFDDVGQLARTQLQDIAGRTSDEMFLSMEKMIAETEQELSLMRGDAYDEKLEVIEQKFQKFKNVHAPAIADYSANNVATSTQQIIMDDKGIKYIWLTQRDGRVRASHRTADGQEPDASGYFTLGDGERTKRPCAPGMTAKNSMRCRCILYPVE